MKVTAKSKEETPSASITFLPTTALLEIDETVNHRPIDKAWVKELQASIEQDGLDVPLTVWDGNGEYEQVKIDGEMVDPRILLSGFHRKAAIKNIERTNKAKFKKLFPNGVPCFLRSGELKEALCAQLRENVARKNPTVEELLPTMIRLRDEFKMKGVQIANSIGRSPSFVSQVFDIEELGEEAVEQVVNGKVSAKDAIKAAKEVKRAKKAGKTPDVKTAVTKAAARTQSRKSKGRDRDEKRVSLRKLYNIYKALPSMTLGRRCDLLETMIQYSLGEVEALPAQLKLKKDSGKKSKAAKGA